MMEWNTGEPKTRGWYLAAWSYPRNRAKKTRGYAVGEVWWEDGWKFDEETEFDPSEDRVDYWQEIPRHPDDVEVEQ